MSKYIDFFSKVAKTVTKKYESFIYHSQKQLLILSPDN